MSSTVDDLFDAGLNSDENKSSDSFVNDNPPSSNTDSTAVKSRDSSKSEAKSSASNNNNSKYRFGRIYVGEPELRGSRFVNEYHVFKIKCQQSSVDHVYRRYNDFVWVRESLLKLFPGLFIPPLPPKKLIGSKDEEFVAERRVGCERFLNRIVKYSYLAESEPMQTFLTKTQTFEESCKEFNKQIGEKKTSDFTQQMRSLLPDLADKQYPSTAEEEIKSFTEYLVNTEKTLSGICNHSAGHYAGNETAVKSLQSFISMLHQLYDLEKQQPKLVGVNPANRLDFEKQFNSWQAAETKLVSSYHTHLVQHFNNELLDVQAMQEILKYRNEQKTKADKAIAKAKKWDNHPCKNDKEETEKSKNLLDAKEQNELLELQTKIILFTQINLFYEQKVRYFKKHMQLMAEQQIIYCKQQLENWETIKKVSSGEDLEDVE